MEPNKSKTPVSPYKKWVPLYDTQKRQFPPSRSSSTQMQAYQAPSTVPSTTSFNASGLSHPSWFKNQGWIDPLQYNRVRDPRRPSIFLIPSLLNLVGNGTQGATLAFSEQLQRMFGEKYQDAKKTIDDNSRSKSLLTLESTDKGKRSSIPPNTNWEGVTWRVASGSRGPPNEGYGPKNDLPSTKMKQNNMMLGNGENAQKVTSTENCDVVHDSSSKEANPTKLNQNLETALNACGIIAPQTQNPEDEEVRRARRRAANREACRKTRIKKKKQYEELDKKVVNLRCENEELKKKLRSLSNKCKRVTKENDSIMEELVKQYGEETAANLTKEILPESIAGH